jgi:hypothetical protein
MRAAFRGTVAEFRAMVADIAHDEFRNWLQANEAELLRDYSAYLEAAAEDDDPHALHTWGSYSLERYLEL